LLGIYLVAAVATVALIALGRSSPLILALPLAAVGITAYGESSILQAFLADHVGRVEQDMAFALYFAVAFGVGSLWAAVLGWVTDVLGFTATFAVITGTYLTTILVLLPTRDAPLKQ
jgi:MFS family permease